MPQLADEQVLLLDLLLEDERLLKVGLYRLELALGVVRTRSLLGQRFRRRLESSLQVAQGLAQLAILRLTASARSQDSERRTGLELLEHHVQIPRTLRLGVPLRSQRISLCPQRRQIPLERLLSLQRLLASDPLVTGLDLPRLALGSYPLQILLRVPQRRLARAGVVQLGPFGVSRARSGGFELAMRRFEVVVRGDQLGTQRLDGEIEVVVAGLERRDALRPQIQLVLPRSAHGQYPCHAQHPA